MVMLICAPFNFSIFLDMFWFCKGSADFLGGGDGKMPPEDSELGKVMTGMGILEGLKENKQNIEAILTKNLADGNTEQSINTWIPFLADGIEDAIRTNKFLQKYGALRNISTETNLQFWGIDEIVLSDITKAMTRTSTSSERMKKAYAKYAPLLKFKDVKTNFSSTAGDTKEEEPKKDTLSKEDVEKMIQYIAASSTIDEFGIRYQQFQEKHAPASPAAGKDSWAKIEHYIKNPDNSAEIIANRISAGGASDRSHRQALEKLIIDYRKKDKEADVKDVEDTGDPIKDFANKIIDTAVNERVMADKASDDKSEKDSTEITPDIAYQVIKKMIDIMSEVERVYNKRLQIQANEGKSSNFTNYEKPLAQG